MVPCLPLLPCESSVSVKENPDRKKKKIQSISPYSVWMQENTDQKNSDSRSGNVLIEFNSLTESSNKNGQSPLERKMISNKVIPGNGGSSNPALSLCETVVKVLTIITNCSILGVWQRCEYVSAFGTNQSFWYIF